VVDHFTRLNIESNLSVHQIWNACTNILQWHKTKNYRNKNCIETCENEDDDKHMKSLIKTEGPPTEHDRRMGTDYGSNYGST